MSDCEHHWHDERNPIRLELPPHQKQARCCRCKVGAVVLIRKTPGCPSDYWADPDIGDTIEDVADFRSHTRPPRQPKRSDRLEPSEG